MSDDMFKSIYGMPGQQLGQLLEKGRGYQGGLNMKELLLASLATNTINYFSNKPRLDREEQLEDLANKMGIVTKEAVAEYNTPDAARKREELAKFNDPTQRENFIYNKSLESVNKMVNDMGGGFAYSPDMQLSPQMEAAINQRLKDRQEYLTAEYEKMNNNPLYNIQTEEEYMRPYLDLLVAEKNLIEDNPANKNAFTKIINKFFPGKYAQSIVDLKDEVNKANKVIADRDAYINDFENLLKGELRAFDVADDAPAYIKTSALRNVNLDSKELDRQNKDLNNVIFEKNGYKNKFIGSEDKSFEPSKRNIDNLELIGGEETAYNGATYFINLTNKVASYYQAFDEQLKAQGMKPRVQDGSTEDYRNIAMQYLVKTGIVDNNTIKYQDDKSLTALKSGVAMDAEGADLFMAMLNENEKENALSLDNEVVRELQLEYNSKRSQYAGEGDVDRRLELEEDLIADKEVIAYLEEGRDDNEDLNAEISLRRTRLILLADEDSTGYITLPNVDSPIRKSDINFAMKSEFYNQHVKEHGENPELKAILTAIEPPAVVSTGPLSGNEKAEVEENLSANQQALKEIQDNNKPLLLTDENLDILQGLDRFAAAEYQRDLQIINRLENEIKTGRGRVKKRGTIALTEIISLNQRQIEQRLDLLEFKLKEFNKRNFPSLLTGTQSSDLQQQIALLEQSKTKYQKLTPVSEIDQKVIDDYALQIANLKEQLSALGIE